MWNMCVIIPLGHFWKDHTRLKSFNVWCVPNICHNYSYRIHDLPTIHVANVQMNWSRRGKYFLQIYDISLQSQSHRMCLSSLDIWILDVTFLTAYLPSTTILELENILLTVKKSKCALTPKHWDPPLWKLCWKKLVIFVTQQSRRTGPSTLISRLAVNDNSSSFTA